MRLFSVWLMGISKPNPSEFLALHTANWVRAAGDGGQPEGLAMQQTLWLRNQRLEARGD